VPRVRFSLRSLFVLVLACAAGCWLWTCLTFQREDPHLLELREQIRNARQLEVFYMGTPRGHPCEYFIISDSKVLRYLSHRQSWPRYPTLTEINAPIGGSHTYVVQVITARGDRRLLFLSCDGTVDEWSSVQIGDLDVRGCPEIAACFVEQHRRAATDGRLKRNASILLMTGVREDLDRYKRRKACEEQPWSSHPEADSRRSSIGSDSRNAGYVGESLSPPAAF